MPALAIILIVEREPPVRRVLREILVRAGYAVLEARNGQAARRVCEQHHGRIDALLIDGPDPETENLANAQPHLRVLGLSGSARAEFAPGTHVLTKPLPPQALLNTLRTMLGHSRK